MMKIQTGFLTILILLLFCGPVLAAEFEPVVNFSAEELVAQVPGAEEQLTFDSVYDQDPRVDERYITWVTNDLEGKVWFYDTKGGKREMVANVPGDQRDPDISGGIVVWDDTRNGDADIYSYNIPMNKEDVVSRSTSNKFNPAISNDIAAFEDYGSDDVRDIAFKKVGSTANPVFINPNSQDKANPDVDGDWIAYQQLDDGREDWNIYLYNIKTQQTIQVTRDISTQINPRISGDLVAWEDNRNGKWDIFMYNLKKDLTTAVTFDDVDDRSPSISGSIIVWTRIAQDGTSDIYMVNLQIPKTYIVSAGPGNQINPDICIDKVVWQDDRFGGWDVFLYTLKPDTPFRSYEFYGPASINYSPAPVGTQILAKVDGRTKDTITVTEEGYYGGQGDFSDRLKVDITQADIGRTITFWVDGYQGSPSIPIAGDGSIREQSLNFMYAKPLPELQLFGSIIIDGQPAAKGTVLTAKIDDVVRGEYTTTQSGQYGGSASGDPTLQIPITEMDLGKHIKFWQNGYLAAEEIQITSGGKMRQDLSFSQITPLTPYEFYGYVKIEGASAPEGTRINAQIDGTQAVSYTTRYAGSYGAPGESPGDPRLIVPVREDDIGKTIYFWSETLKASASQIITRQGERIVRKDLDFSTAPGISADFTADPRQGLPPLTVQFTDLSTGNPSMWAWDFGEGVIPMNECSGGGCNNIANPVHTYAQAGTYTVTLTASNQYGDADTEVKQGYITVGSTPSFNADFVGSPTSGISPLSVRFTDLSVGGPTMWSWDFGDGATDTVANPVHTYQAYGSYSVTLTAGNQNGESDTEKKVNYISVMDVPPSPDSIPISAGWNFVSVPKKLAPGKDTAAIFGNIDVDGHSIFQFDSVKGQWVTLSASSLIKPLDAVWLYSKNVNQVPLNFDTDPLQIPPTRELKKGWNAVGFSGFEPLEAKFTFLSVQDRWINCLGFDQELQRYNEMIIKGRNDDTRLVPYSGYWLFMTDDGVLAAISA
ncbi:MAG TPA: PKD domain-containing protein [Methanospirillum sp.]|nr:PKD domain-containing protein [Methanospirillum sp.]